jgi:transcriptional regulator with XRE-family HTH domain
MDMKINTAKIIDERQARAWSQQTLADRTNLSLRTIQRVENTGNASLESIKAISEVFNLKPTDLKADPKKLESKSPIYISWGITIGSLVGIFTGIYWFEMGLSLLFGTVSGLIIGSIIGTIVDSKSKAV